MTLSKNKGRDNMLSEVIPNISLDLLSSLSLNSKIVGQPIVTTLYKDLQHDISLKKLYKSLAQTILDKISSPNVILWNAYYVGIKVIDSLNHSHMEFRLKEVTDQNNLLFQPVTDLYHTNNTNDIKGLIEESEEPLSTYSDLLEKILQENHPMNRQYCPNCQRKPPNPVKLSPSSAAIEMSSQGSLRSSIQEKNKEKTYFLRELQCKKEVDDVAQEIIEVENEEKQVKMQNSRLHIYLKQKEDLIQHLKLEKISNLKMKMIGLGNYGNICYMNAALQCLSRTLLFSDYFLQKYESQKSDSSSKLSHIFSKFIREIIWPSNYGTNYSLKDLTLQIKSIIAEMNPDFVGNDQHDSFYFIENFLNRIHQEENRVPHEKKPKYQNLKAQPFKGSLQDQSDDWFDYSISRENSIITDFFVGQLLHEVTCGQCGQVSISFETFQSLSLAFTDKTQKEHSLFELLNGYFHEEEIANHKCNHCKHISSTGVSNSSIRRLPEILILHLKRSQECLGGYKKISDDIIFPIKDLDLESFIGELSKDNSCQETKYSLFAVIDHYGSLEQGHYTADCLNYNDKKWYHFDDFYVRESKIQSDKELYCSAPSILFYIKSSYIQE